MATVYQLGPGEFAVGSASGGGLMTNKGNVFISRASTPNTYTNTPGGKGGGPNPYSQNVLGAATTNNGGGVGAPVRPTAPAQDPSQGLAQAGLDNNVQMIRDLFNTGKEQVNNERTNINKRFQDILDAVGAFRTRAGTLRDNAGQEITNQASDSLGSNATTAQELAGSANAQGRNLGLSSKVNLGNKLLSNLQQTQGKVVAARGEQQRANNDVYQGREDQAAQQQRDAQTTRDAGLAAADTYDRQNVDTYGSNIQGAQLNFANLLNNISQRSQSLAAINPVNASTLASYAPDYSGIMSTIGNVLGNTGGAAGAAAPTVNAANLAQDPTYQAYLKKLGLYTG